MSTKALHALLSLFLIYHLSAAIIVPNYNSILGEMVGGFFIKYANTFSLSTPWQFFSPDPSVKLDWEYTLDLSDPNNPEEDLSDETIDAEMKVYIWPPRESTELYRVSYYRKMYQSRITSSPEKVFKKLFIGWLCKKHPEAYGINIRARVQSHPPLDSNKLSEVIRNLQLQKQEFESRDWPYKNHPCPKAGGEA